MQICLINLRKRTGILIIETRYTLDDLYNVEILYTAICSV